MADYRVPDAGEAQLLREMDMDPDKFAVMLRGPDWMLLLNYKTRHTVRIDRGDREWNT